MKASKKQIALYKDILAPNVPRINVEGSTQSGKTHIICAAIIEYARILKEYEEQQRLDPNYIPRTYYGAIIGWTNETLKGNIIEQLEEILKNEYHFVKDKHYTLKFGQYDKYFEIYGLRIYFFGFNTKLSFNSILGKPLIFLWVDEAARIYTQQLLRESFDQLPGRQTSFAGHPYYKRINSFNVEGSQNHPYKLQYIDVNTYKYFVFFPYDNPVLDTEEKIREVVNSFPPGSLREQKIFNKWVVAEGKVFNHIPIIEEEEVKNKYIIVEIGIGCDYGSVNATTFSAIALAQNKETMRWNLLLIDRYYHDPKTEGDTPTTEFYSNQIKAFMDYLHKKYPHIPINNLVIDSEAAHFDNRLTTDGIRHDLAKKNTISVDESVQYMQSLFYKEFLKVMETDYIRYFLPNGEPIFGNHDICLEELESYHYDKIKSEREGVNAYVKEFDHYVDGTRYIIMELQIQGRAPVI